ncbi:MAG TPA: ChrR family anti-sigma-E factor [Xanthobacteraceae bacterium]|jgi:putative transcriptional regulator|nr:ChrR family anti-sigma-E factor [Xanthobacteraceae bacterium]
MSIKHHPSDEMLAAFAAGTLDHGQHIAIATHLVACERCRNFARSVEQVGGAILVGLQPTAISDRALAAVEARLGEPERVCAPEVVPTLREAEIPGLPKFLRRYRFGAWKWIAPAVHLRPIALPCASDSRVFLLKAGPGTKMLRHTHTGTEMTCVLTGAFRQDGARYGPGDFDLGDETNNHRPLVERGQDCICLVAMHGELKLRGLIGRMVQPLVRL